MYDWLILLVILYMFLYIHIYNFISIYKGLLCPFILTQFTQVYSVLSILSKILHIFLLLVQSVLRLKLLEVNLLS